MKKAIAACVAVMTVLASAAPAWADGYGHGHRHGGWTYRHHGHGDGAALFAGGLLLGALVGLAAQPRVVYAAPPAPVATNCRPITGTGYVNGRLARFAGTGCYDAYGNLYAVPGSARFLHYVQ